MKCLLVVEIWAEIVGMSYSGVVSGFRERATILTEESQVLCGVDKDTDRQTDRR